MGLVAGALVAAGLLGARGQREANASNLALSDENRRWMEVMSDTAFQRQVRDLKAAGLNPMLSFQQGGASSPSAQAPKVENVMAPAMSSAVQAASVMQGVQGMAQSEAQTTLLKDQAAKVRSETLSNDLHSARLAAEIKNIGSQTQLTNAHWDNVQQQILGTIADSATKHAVFQEMNKGGFAADVARKKAESEIARFGVAEAKAGSQFYEGLGQMNPYLRMFIELIRGASSARSLGR